MERVLGGVRNETARWTAFAIWLGVEWPAFTARRDLDVVAILASDSQGFKSDGQKINTRRDTETPSNRIQDAMCIVSKQYTQTSTNPEWG